jgi:SET domain
VPTCTSRILKLFEMYLKDSIVLSPNESQSLKDCLEEISNAYIVTYLHDVTFQITTTTLYSDIPQVCVTARRPIKGVITNLIGVLISITPEEEENFEKEGDDFTLTDRGGRKELLLGNVRFINHDCRANTNLIVNGSRVKCVTKHTIRQNEEITIYYGKHYFGSNNCECRCQTCKGLRRNGWSEENGERGGMTGRQTSHPLMSLSAILTELDGDDERKEVVIYEIK